MNDLELESRTLAHGREIFARVQRQAPHILTPAWFDDLLMQLTMSEESLKVQLFRFIDALPVLHSAETVALHFKEYLRAAGKKLPWWLRLSTRFLPENGLGGRLLARSAFWNARHLARRFIVGTNVPEALETIRYLRTCKMAFTVDLLGEATITEAEADAVRDQYLHLLDGLGPVVNRWDEQPEVDRDEKGRIPRVNVSVKLSALNSQFDPIDPVGTGRVVKARLRPILRSAQAQRAFVNFDMEQYSFKDTTL